MSNTDHYNDLLEAPENPDWADQFTDEQAEAIEKRFHNGIELGKLYDARAARLAREASLACHARFNGPKALKRARKDRPLTTKFGEALARATTGR